MGAFIIPAVVIIAILVFMIWRGEERFNALFDWFKCAHEWKYLDEQGEIDNDNPCVAKCDKCGKKRNIKE